MKSNVTIMPIKTFLEERIRQQKARRVVIENSLGGVKMIASRPQYTKDDLIAIDNDISDCKKCLSALTATLIVQP